MKTISKTAFCNYCIE